LLGKDFRHGFGVHSSWIFGLVDLLGEFLKGLRGVEGLWDLLLIFRNIGREAGLLQLNKLVTIGLRKERHVGVACRRRPDSSLVPLRLNIILCVVVRLSDFAALVPFHGLIVLV